MPIYSVRGPDGLIYDIQGPEGASERQIINAARQYYLSQQRQVEVEEPAPPPQPEPPRTERTTGQALFQDPAASLVSGVGKLAQLPAQVYGLVTGDMDTILARPGKAIEEFGQQLKSPGLIAREQERSKKIREAEEKSGQFAAMGEAIKQTITDPGLFPSFLLEQAPGLIPVIGAAKLVQGTSYARALASGLGASEAAKVASQAGTKAAIGAAAVQQGADVGAGAYERIYDTLIKGGMSERDAADEAINSARAAGASGAIISLLSQKLPGARAAEEVFAGVPGAGTRLGRIAKGTAGESIQEMVEETGGRLTQNIALREFAPETQLTSGLGEAAGMAAIGGGTLGAVTGALQRGKSLETFPKPQPKPEVETPPQIEPPVVEPVSTGPGEPPVTPTVEPVKAPEPTEEAPKPDFVGYETGLPDESKDFFNVLQNRNRATDQSIKQMQSVASDPDYGRLRVSFDLSSGAPVVISDRTLDEGSMGKIDTATGSDGRRIPVRYAVVEASDLLPSHDSLGNKNAEYGDLNVEALRAVAGNGRIAGLQTAYERGTAEKYKQELLSDVDHGISRETIEGMNQPVLVRVMPKSFVTPDIADISNVSGILRLSPVEAAKNDLKRINLEGIQFNEDGSFNPDSLMQFVQGMPIDEQGELLDNQGRPNSKAVDRLNNAIFYKAYGSEPLIDLYAQAADPEAKMVLAALARAAANVSRLEGAGEYDIRPYIVNAAEQAVNAKRQGKKLADFAEQRDIGTDDFTYAVMQMMAKNSRSGKRMGELLSDLANAAYEQTQAEPDMFGDVPKKSLKEIFGALNPKKEPEGKPPSVEEPKGPPERIEFRIDKDAAKIMNEVRGMSIPQLAQWAVDNAPNTAAKDIAAATKKMIDKYASKGVYSPKIKVLTGGNRSTRAIGKVRYRYSAAGMNMELSLNGPGPTGAQDGLTGTQYETILHELLHAATIPHLEFNRNSEEYKDLVKISKVLADKIKNDKANNVDHPFLTFITSKKKEDYFLDPHEMISWALTNKDYQDYVSKIKYQDTNMFSAIVQALRKLLNLNEKYETALEAIARNAADIVSTNIDEISKAMSARGIPLVGLPPKTGRVRRGEVVKETELTRQDVGEAIKKGKEKVSEALRKRRIPAESMKDIDPELVDLAEPIFFPKHKTIIDRIDGMRDNFWKKLAQGIADEFRTIKDYSEEAYMLARLSKSFDGALEGLLFHGQVFDDGGALNIKKNTTGLVEAMKPIGNEVDRYQMWIALNREANLPEEKRSRIENLDTLVARRSEFAEGTLDGRPRIEVYNEVRQKLNAINNSVLTVAKDKGLIESSQDEIKRISEDRQPTPKDRMILSEPIQKQIDSLKAQLDALTDTDPTAADQRLVIKDNLRVLRDRLSEINKADKWDSSEKTELIQWYNDNPGAYERFMSDIWYIPFYREMENGDVSAARSAAGLSNQYFSKALEGGGSPFGDLMDNVLRNWSHILSASLKNGAAVATVKAAEPLGGVEPNLKKQYYMLDGLVHYQSNDEVVGDGSVQPWMTSSEGKQIAKVMVDGFPMYFKVLDPMLLESIMSIGYMGPKSKFLDIARTAKNWLQAGVTISPIFKTNNLIRDSVAAPAVSELKKNPITNVLMGIESAKQGDKNYIGALSGGAIFNFGTVYEGDSAALVKRLIEKGVPRDTILTTPEQVKKAMKTAWDKYQEWGNRFEAANRLALYKQLRDQGMSHLEATFKARDLLDFSMQGAWGSWRLLTQTVPFLNARVQGLYKLGRDGIIPTTRVFYNTITGQEINQTDKQKAQSFSIITGATTFATLALYLAFKDDEEFQKRDNWDRDNFWWFKLPGMEYALRVPKPFEIGAIATLAERSLEQIIDQGAEGKQFQDSLSRMLFETFAFNLPQIIKPLVDLSSNKDSFTGAPIESAGMERLSKAERYTDTTSALAKALGGVSNVFLPEKAEISPVQMDYAIKAYFGWLGGTIAWASNYAVAPFKNGEYPDEKWVDKVSLGYLRGQPDTRSRYVTSFYEYNKKFSQALSDMRHYAAIGETDKVQQILEEKGDRIAMARFYDSTSKSMANIRSQIRVVTNDTTMTGEEKREAIDRMKLLISDLAKQAEEARKMMKK